MSKSSSLTATKGIISQSSRPEMDIIFLFHLDSNITIAFHSIIGIVDSNKEEPAFVPSVLTISSQSSVVSPQQRK